MSNLRKPSCPCVFAFSVTGCAKVRPAEVRASKWSDPAAISTNLQTLTLSQAAFRGAVGTHFSPHPSFASGVMTAKSLSASSPHNHPVPHHGELAGVGVLGRSACSSDEEESAYICPDADNAYTRVGVSWRRTMF